MKRECVQMLISARRRIAAAFALSVTPGIALAHGEQITYFVMGNVFAAIAALVLALILQLRAVSLVIALALAAAGWVLAWMIASATAAYALWACFLTGFGIPLAVPVAYVVAVRSRRGRTE